MNLVWSIGVWHDPRSYPTSWQLDDKEGPGRVRVRLRRAHLNIPPKFLKPQFRYKNGKQKYLLSFTMYQIPKYYLFL